LNPLGLDAVRCSMEKINNENFERLQCCMCHACIPEDFQDSIDAITVHVYCIAFSRDDAFSLSLFDLEDYYTLLYEYTTVAHPDHDDCRDLFAELPIEYTNYLSV